MEKKEIKEKKLTDEEIVKALEFKANVNAKVAYLDGCACKHIWVADILDLIHRLQAENERLKGLCSKSSYKDSWKNKFFKAQEEIEYLKQHADQFLADYQKAQKQVDELKDERENMQAEILRFEDMKFTQEHCDLYSENETLKQWLKRLNADLECEKNCGKIQTKQAVKDTAKEICDLILEHWEKKQFVECDWLRVAISEKYGVEVE